MFNATSDPLIIEWGSLPPPALSPPRDEGLVLHGKVMVSRLAFSMKMLPAAVEFCQREREAGQECVIVRRDECLLIYTEQASEIPDPTGRSGRSPPSPPPPAEGPGDETPLSPDSQAHDEIALAPPVDTSLGGAALEMPPTPCLTLASEPREDSDATSTVDWEPNFLEICQDALMDAIGPIAPLILDEVLSQYSPRAARDLIDLLSAQIPDAQAAHQFQTRLQHVRD